jgi:acetate kinase
MAVHKPGSGVQVWVVPTDEGRVAAREAAQLMARGHFGKISNEKRL